MPRPTRRSTVTSETRPSASSCPREARTSARGSPPSRSGASHGSRGAERPVTDVGADLEHRLPIDRDTHADEVAEAVRTWIGDNLPLPWREAAERGGAAAIRQVRSREEYQAWYPVFGRSGMVVPTWPADYGG